MKITCLIDTLNSGGAQRQMVNLLVALKLRGYDVTLITYFPLNHFEFILKKNSVDHILIESNSRILRIFKIKKEVKKLKTDVLISFLDIPNFIAQIISFPFFSQKTIVSERVLEIGQANLIRRVNRILYRFVDFVTANSNSNRELILKNAPWSRKKIKVIYNSVDLEKFNELETGLAMNNRIIAVASFRKTKNPIGLIKAIKLITELRPDLDFIVEWFGHKNSDYGNDESIVFSESEKTIESLKLNKYIKLRGPVTNIEEKYHASTALILPSFTEGLPNVVCEAMACGLPILMSDVADAKNLVNNDINGYLFDPNSIQSIASTMINFLDLQYNNRKAFGRASRVKAEKLFSIDRYVNNYIDVINKL